MDNAICLCFDCHADAGHYNAQHPRGTRFSPAELRQHRDTWHEIVRRGGLDSATDATESIHFRYYLCKNLDVVRELASGDFHRLPSVSLVLQNEVLAFQRDLVGRYEYGRFRHRPGPEYASLESFRESHPTAVLIAGVPDPFVADWVPAADEVADPATRLAHDLGAPMSELAVANLIREMGCDEINGVRVEYLQRQLWFVYLGVHNLSTRSAALSHVESAFRRDSTYVPLQQVRSSGLTTHPLPLSPLLPGETMWIPVATVLAPLGHDLEDVRNDAPSFAWQPKEADESEWEGQTQDLLHRVEASAEGFHAIGPAHFPRAVLGSNIRAEAHEFDLTNYYVVSRYFWGSSCPHYFGLRMNGDLLYIGKCLGLPNEPIGERVLVPAGCQAVVVAELEWEISTIQVNPGGRTEGRATIHLMPGEYVVVRGREGEVIELLVEYRPLSLPLNGPVGHTEDAPLVRSFLRRWRRRSHAEKNLVLRSIATHDPHNALRLIEE